MKNKQVIITGGTDGIGAACALAFSEKGADVTIVGRSEEKADRIIQLSKNRKVSGSIRSFLADFSSMHTSKETARKIAKEVTQVDLLLHGVGILINKTEYTEEGVEKGFAVSYLSRFAFTEELHRLDLLTPGTVMLNIAASSPKVPSSLQLEFNDLEQVKTRVGLKSHGQAQLANDLFTAFAAVRYKITTVGYGPGSVDTSIRRELPKLLILLMKPFFYFSTRKPEKVAEHFLDILAGELDLGKANFFNKNGRFPMAEFVAEPKRQADLLNVSHLILEQITNRKNKTLNS
ncbi:MAG: SDR family NAD(P)-dependent oxidoreductase [Bacteroidota bacterium]